MASGDPFPASKRLVKYINSSQAQSTSRARLATPTSAVLPTGTSSRNYAIEQLVDDPDAYYRMGETGALTTAEDFSGNANHGTYGGVVVNAAGGLYMDNDSAKSFNGTDAFASLPMTLGENVLIEGLFIWTAGTQLLRDSTSGSDGWSLAFSSLGTLRFRVAGTNYNTGVDLTDVQNGAWHHYALWKEGPNVSYSLDGAEVFTADDALDTESTGDLIVMKDGFTSSYTTGRADEISVFSNPPDVSRVAVHYAAFTGASV